MSEEATLPASPLPIALRRSYQLNALEVFLLGIGAWLLIGVFGGFDPVAMLAGGQTGLAYLLFAVLILPTILAHIELRQWIRESGGTYRLLQRVERPAVTFLAGWAYLLAWASLSGLIAWSFASQLAPILSDLALVDIGRLPLLLGFVLLFAVLNASGRRPAWSLGLRFAGLVALSLLVLLLALGRQLISISDGLEPLAQRGNLFTAIASLGGGLWVLELLAERRRPGQVSRAAVLGTLAGPLLIAALGGVGARIASDGLNLQALGEQAFPAFGGYVILGIGALAILLLWHGLSLIMLRQLQSLGSDGVLPGWLLKGSPRRGNPTRLSIFQAALTLVALIAVQGFFPDPPIGALALSGLAAAAFLLLHLGANLASIVMGRGKPANTSAFRLPLFPLFPAAGAGICFLLLQALPTWTRALLIGWLFLGALAYWQGGRKRMHDAQLGITVFQDLIRHSRIDTDYPVVVPIANPDTASGLVALGAAIAGERGGHLVLLQVILVPEHLSLDRGRFEARKRLDLLERLIAEAEGYGVPVEGVTRLSRSITQGILDTVAEESARMVVMGSNVRPQTGSSGFGGIVDEILESAACEVAVARGDGDLACKRIIVPISEREEGTEAARLALAIAASGDGKVSLIHVARMEDGDAGLLAGQIILDAVAKDLEGADRFSTEVIAAGSPLEGILRASQGADLILLGASEQGLLDEEHFGRLPLQLAMRSEVPLLLMRSQEALPTYVARRAWRSVADLLPTLTGEEQMAVFRRLRLAARPNVNYFVLITLSAVIASLGLLLDSPAVVIGAMLVAPLMSPIVAAAVGISFGDTHTLRDSFAATLQGMLVAVFIAIIMALIVPGAEATPEVLARAEPTLIDLIIALASGMAGAYAIARKEVGEALPGVAIAAALLPPLASVGIGIALADASIAGGALLLFITNLIAIVFAASLVFLLLGMRPPRVEERELRLRQGLVISVLSLLVVSIPLAFFLWRTVQRESIESRAREYVEQRVEAWGAVGLDDFMVSQSRDTLSLTGTVYAQEPIDESEMIALERELAHELGQQVSIELFVLYGEIVQPASP